MLCPVCKTECGIESVCKECGFDQIQVEFLNREEATYWMENIVLPFRTKWQDTQNASLLDWQEILFRQKDISYFFNVTIPAATSKNAVLGHVLLVCQYPRFLNAFTELLENAIPYRNVKRVEEEHKMKMGDVWAVFTNLNEYDICVQKIKTIPTDADSSKHFQTALKGFYTNIQIGKGPGAREVRLELPPFTFMAIAAKMSDVPKAYLPLFENVIEIKFNELDACKIEIQAVASELELKILPSAIEAIAMETKNDIGEATRCLKHISDFMFVKGMKDMMVTVDLIREVFPQFM